MPDIPTLLPGQKLLFVPSRRGAAREVEVERVATKWAYLKGNQGRISKRTLVADGGGYDSPGRCYLSRENYEAELCADRRWALFHMKVLYRRPSRLDAETINQAAALLGMGLPEDTGDG